MYDEFQLCPNESMRQKINQAALLVENWHTLMPLKEQDRSVVKKGAETAPRGRQRPGDVLRIIYIMLNIIIMRQYVLSVVVSLPRNSGDYP